jgi:hypothetical protein
MSALGGGKGQLYAPVVLFRYRLPNTLGRCQRTSTLADDNKHSACTGNEYLCPASTELETKLFNFTFPPWLIRRPWLELGYCALFMLVKNRQPCFSSFIKAHSRSVTPSARRGKQARDMRTQESPADRTQPRALKYVQLRITRQRIHFAGWAILCASLFT